MNLQEFFKSSQFLADIYPVFSGSPCRLIDHNSRKKLFLFDACPVSAALNFCHPSTDFGRVA